MTSKTDAPLTTSKGHSMSEANYLDSHYLACQPEYEMMLKSVGLQAGWRVLDAGCGSGSFLPLMSQLIGPTGQIDALDMAPENVAHVQGLQDQGVYACPVTVQAGSVSQLPYEDDTFDAIWCANTTQYLSDDDLQATLTEFQRVLKPAGLLALKESNVLCLQWQPMDPLLWARTMQALVEIDYQYVLQLLRGAALPTWVKHAGFKVNSAKTVMIERRQSLSGSERSYITSLLGRIAQVAKTHDSVSVEDEVTWARLGLSSSPDFILNHPDFYYSEGNVMITAGN